MENHVLNIDNREKITVTGVTDIENASEETVLVLLQKGGLMIKGQKLHIQKLDLGEGKTVITGSIQSAVYTEKKEKQEGGFWKKLLK